MDKSRNVVYYCKDCKRQISSKTALYGLGRCKTCSNKSRIGISKISINKLALRKLYKTSTLKELANLFKCSQTAVKLKLEQFKIPLRKQKLLKSIKRLKRSLKRFWDKHECPKGKDSIHWKGGLPKCISCGERVANPYATHCLLCSRKLQFKIPENNPNWKGGISKLPYSFNFTVQLKQEIRERDSFICQCCGLNENAHIKNNKKINLCIHHIDYDKENNKKKNLISLCINCHTKTNGDRDYWFTYFTYLMENV